jgi:hypothetical protein
MMALSKFLVLLAFFLLASHANGLSSVAGNQVWMNHFIQFEESMSKPTNKLSSIPISEPTNNQMNDPNHYKEEPLQEHCCTDLGIQSKLIFTCEKTNGHQQLTHSENSGGGRLALLLLSGHKSVWIQLTSLYLTNYLRQSQSFVDDISIDLWQCQMEINKVKSMKTAQSAIGSMCKSFQSRGPCHVKTSEQVENSASTQPQGYNFILIATCHQCHHNLDSNCHATKIGVVTNKLINHLLEAAQCANSSTCKNAFKQSLEQQCRIL